MFILLITNQLATHEKNSTYLFFNFTELVRKTIFTDLSARRKPSKYYRMGSGLQRNRQWRFCSTYFRPDQPVWSHKTRNPNHTELL